MDVILFYVLSLLYRFLVFPGFGIPLLFTLLSGLVIAAKCRTLFPVVVILLLYQAAAFMVVSTSGIPGLATLLILGGLVPVSLAVGGCVWTVKVADRRRDRILGILVSVLGCMLTAGQAVFSIFAIWHSV